MERTRQTRLHRSFLYVPATRPDRLVKALSSGADVVICDLEDAVAPSAKEEGRCSLAGFLDQRSRAAHPEPRSVGTPLHARINRDGGGYLHADLDAAVRPGIDGLRLPKAEDPAAITEAAAQVAELELKRGIPEGHIEFCLLIESALGLDHLSSLSYAHPRVTQFALGTTDLLLDLGIPDDDPIATVAFRSELVLRSRLAGLLPPVDSVHTRLDDLDGLRSGAEWARRLGFFGKSVIHPGQLSIVHQVFSPTASELERARQLVDAFESAEGTGLGAFVLDGDFVDIAVVERARAVLARAEVLR
jgi:citrate lyase subunit beta/citryl-CoA lyase